MKKIFNLCLTIVSGTVLFLTMASAAEINGGVFNPVTKKVELNVSYGGGCSEHSFELEPINGCLESFPVQCTLSLLHTTDKPDFCEAFITRDLELDLPAEFFSDAYYTGAYLTIMGAGQTSFSFQLAE